MTYAQARTPETGASYTGTAAAAYTGANTARRNVELPATTRSAFGYFAPPNLSANRARDALGLAGVVSSSLNQL